MYRFHCKRNRKGVRAVDTRTSCRLATKLEIPSSLGYFKLFLVTSHFRLMRNNFPRSTPVSPVCLFQRGSPHSGDPSSPSFKLERYPPFCAPLETTMSHSIPREIFDLIIDHLRDEPTTLKRCCIVSKAWVQRARKHLFVTVKLRCLSSRPVGRWRETFPDPTNSPARHTRTLFILDPQPITVADVNTLVTFCGVVNLRAHTSLSHEPSIFVPLHGFSPVLRSLSLSFRSLPHPEIFAFICPFPLLEDLILNGHVHRGGDEGWNAPSTSPRLTGSLDLCRTYSGARLIADRLLDLPNGLYFTKIAMTWRSERDILSTVSLMSRCSGTLEYLDITNYLSGTLPSASAQFMIDSLILHTDASGAPSLDLSKLTKLQGITFRCNGSNVQRIITALQTVELATIKQVSLLLSFDVLWQPVSQEWLNLDSLLVQFWTSHSFRLKVICETMWGFEDQRKTAARLLPELAKRGIVDSGSLDELL